ncbi:hypothetical protein TB2_016748 [Malus domestica]
MGGASCMLELNFLFLEYSIAVVCRDVRLAFNVQTLSRLHLEACGYVLKFKETDLPKLDNITGLLSFICRAVASLTEVKLASAERICLFIVVLIESKLYPNKWLLILQVWSCRHFFVVTALLGRQIVVPSIVGFGSETSSRNQVMQCCCLLSKDGISGVPKRCIAVIVYISTCFDESSSWGNADWSCSTLLGFVVADFKCLQHYRRKQCHGVFACLDWATKCL